MLQVRAVLGCPPARGRSPSANRPGQATVYRVLAGMVLAAQLGCFVSCPGFVEISVFPRDHVGVKAHDQTGPPCLPAVIPHPRGCPAGWSRSPRCHPTSAAAYSATEEP
jgi:hypothetical protein